MNDESTGKRKNAKKKNANVCWKNNDAKNNNVLLLKINAKLIKQKRLLELLVSRLELAVEIQRVMPCKAILLVQVRRVDIRGRLLVVH